MGSLTVSYGGNMIHTSSADETFTLQTSGKYASDDITLTGTNVTSMTITYGGQTIDTGTGSFTHKLLTSGKLISGDIGIAVVMAVADIKATVDNLGASDPTTVTFTKTSGFTVAGLGIEEVTFNGDIFIKIPTMYRKVNTVTNNQITSFTIANKQIDSTYQPYPCFVAEDGNTVLPYILIGKYLTTSSSSMISTTAGNGRAINPNKARTYARNRGTGYQLFDWMIFKLWQDLLTVLNETINKVTLYLTDYDALGLYCASSSVLIDGVTTYSNKYYVSYRPSVYANSTIAGYKAIYNCPSNSTAYTIQHLGYSSSDPFVNFATLTTEDNSRNYYIGQYRGSTGYHPGYNQARGSIEYGVYSVQHYLTFSNMYAQRLCYRPIS